MENKNNLLYIGRIPKGNIRSLKYSEMSHFAKGWEWNLNSFSVGKNGVDHPRVRLSVIEIDFQNSNLLFNRANNISKVKQR